MARQCAVLFVNPRAASAYPAYLRETGFAVFEIRDWPAPGEDMRRYHVVIVRVTEVDQAPMLAARLRARPHATDLLLIALVPPEAPLQAQRSAQSGGFDDVVVDGCENRQLMARILKGLRVRPELRCSLPPLPARRSAA